MLSLTAEPCLTKLDAVAGSDISLVRFSALMLAIAQKSHVVLVGSRLWALSLLVPFVSLTAHFLALAIWHKRIGSLPSVSTDCLKRMSIHHRVSIHNRTSEDFTEYPYA